jgi:hypothetical protein
MAETLGRVRNSPLGEYWLSSWPVNGKIRKVFTSFENRANDTGADWMPDSRHVLRTGSVSPSDSIGSLYMGDTLTDTTYPLASPRERCGRASSLD